VAKQTKASKPEGKPNSGTRGRPFEKGTQPHAGRPFTKGQSGNPAGRPKIYQTLVTQALVKKLGVPLAEEFTPDELEKMNLLTDAEKRTLADALAHQLIMDAFSGDDVHAKYKFRAYLIDRAEGKPKQQVDVSGLGADYTNRTNAELKFFLEHRYWPENALKEEANQPDQTCQTIQPNDTFCSN